MDKIFLLLFLSQPLKSNQAININQFDIHNFQFKNSANLNLHPIYFGKRYENITHIGVHFFISIWKPKYSLIAAISIEGADTINGKFDLNDWIARLSGCMSGYLFKKYILKRRKKQMNEAIICIICEEPFIEGSNWCNNCTSNSNAAIEKLIEVRAKNKSIKELDKTHRKLLWDHVEINELLMKENKALKETIKSKNKDIHVLTMQNLKEKEA